MPMLNLNLIYAGDSRTVSFQPTADAPIGSGFVPHLSIVNGQYGKIIDGQEGETGYDIEITSTVSNEIPVGRYDWVAYLTNSATGARITLAADQIIVKPNPASATAIDKRTHARKMLDAIEAILEGRGTNGDLDVIKLQVPGARRADFDPAQLLPMRDKYRAEVVAEERAAAVARGERINNTLKVRFS